ncbi:MAG: Na+/H+ antiporter [Acidimicrobiia bacterium]|nr:Na+/H+ antiporter [Acidimicrobiia bacterium]
MDLPSLFAAQEAGLLNSEVSIVLLLAVAAAVAVAVRRIRIPYTVALVVVGLGLAFLPTDVIQIDVSADLILAVLVPPLLFEATVHISWGRLKRDLAPVLLFALVGTLLGAFVVGGFVAGLVEGVPWPAAVAFGALISATDPVAVIAFFRSIGVSKRLTILVEGESLFNDGVAFVVFTLALAAAGPGATFSLGAAVGQFFIDALGGLAIGLALGYVVSSLILKNLDDHLIETVVTVALAFGSYLLAEEFGAIFDLADVHLSGILAVVAAGLMVGNIGLRNTSPTTRLTLENFWEFAAFVVNSLVFLLLGLQIHISELWDKAGAVLVALVAIQVTRLFVVYGLGTVHGFAQPDRKVPRRYQHVMFWGGLRGAISVALALSLVGDVDRLGEDVVSTLQVMTFGVVLFTLLVQGLTIERLIMRLGLAAKPVERVEQQRRQARIYAQQAGLDELGRLHDQGVLFQDLYDAMAGLYMGELARDGEELRNHLRRYPELETDMYIRARTDTLRAERSALQDAARRGLIAEDVLTELTADINDHLAALEFIEGDARQGDIMQMPSEQEADGD